MQLEGGAGVDPENASKARSISTKAARPLAFAAFAAHGVKALVGASLGPLGEARCL